jgi:hypothetical protein
MEFPDSVEEKKTPVKAFGLEHCVLLDNTFCTPNKLLTVVHSHPRNSMWEQVEQEVSTV